MTQVLEQRIAALTANTACGEMFTIGRGIEKEGLRTTPVGELSQSKHPHALGSALTHPHITTDYSEALLEFITPVYRDAEGALEFLEELHRFCYQNLGDELIWSASMPCFLGGEDSIPIAEYGASNVAMLKHIYRVGLKWRYGKMMQTIAGIHYNFSLPDSFWPEYQQLLGDTSDLNAFQTSQYFSLIRNFRRYSWLILLLMGASPAMCSSFIQGAPHSLQRMKGKALYLPHATSLRMGDLGYQSNAQADLYVCHNSLEDYVTTLGEGVNTSYLDYEKIGVKVNGEYRQLNSHLLQIENEFYSEIRPKRVTPSGRKPLHVLSDQGVEYIEVRNLDINPFEPLGLSAQQIHFVDCFLLYCLFEDSPLTDIEEYRRQLDNKALVVNRGREPGLTLQRDANTAITVQEWARQLMSGIDCVAQLMDEVQQTDKYSQACASERAKIEDLSLTPSARILNHLVEDDVSFFEFAMTRANEHKDALTQQSLSKERNTWFAQVAETSHQQQADIEAADKIAFDQFLANYLAQ